MNAFARLRCGGLPFRAALLCPRFEGVRRVFSKFCHPAAKYLQLGVGRRYVALNAPGVAFRDSVHLAPIFASVRLLRFTAQRTTALTGLVLRSCAVLCHAAKSSAYFTRPQAAQGVGGF
jgi:hypothetical protein